PGATGPTGADGLPGEKGEQGATGPIVQLPNQITNGGMETFSDDIPTEWFGPALAQSAQVLASDDPDLVHSGNSAVMLMGTTGTTSTTLSQNPEIDVQGASFKCSFSAMAEGSPSLIATLIFYKGKTPISSSSTSMLIQVGSLPDRTMGYGQYFFMTDMVAPLEATNIQISFTANNLSEDGVTDVVYIDDVFIYI
ncbi:MAG: collagen-like protein, partial [bacterium]|nr:collagen-like protein [bacterium]